MKNYFSVFASSPFFFLGVFLISVCSCDKEDNKNDVPGIPELTTSVVTDITDLTATSGGIITSDGGATVTVRGVCWSIRQNPTINDKKTEDGLGDGSFTSTLSGLESNTTYYLRAYATNISGTGYGSPVSFTTQKDERRSSFTDPRDGKVYQTIMIGSQEWMAENLKYLPSVVRPAMASATTPYYYVYGYNGIDVSDAMAEERYITYGVLYNWPAAMDGSESSNTNPSNVQGVCPDGWHLPSDAEWHLLSYYLGDANVGGGKLKEMGTDHWLDPNDGATNEFGFTALPGGHRYGTDSFGGVRRSAYWWSATEYNSERVWYRNINNTQRVFYRSHYLKESGFSVRCVRD